MGLIARCEDLECWKEARILARRVYNLTKRDVFDQDRELRWQLRAAATSSMRNIAEGFGRYSFEDKRRFFDIALGSCKEVQSQLYVALDQGYLTEDEFGEAHSRAETVARLITGSLAHLERQIVSRRPNHGRGRTVRKQPT